VELARISGALEDNHSGVISMKGSANALAASLLKLKSGVESNGAFYIALGDAEVAGEVDKSLQGVTYLAVQASYASEITERADVVLPAATWAEETGHFINLEGVIQQTAMVLKAAPGIKSNADILTALAEKMGTQLSTDWQSPIHAGKSPVALHQ
jgi:NADH dehydrogenase/NADH:ubiquinone oxidoreductase subunit G